MTIIPEPRINTALGVWVSGRDKYGNRFKQTATVENISRHGARIREIRCLDSPGAVVTVTYRSKQANFRVVWISPFSGRVGVCSVDDAYIWGKRLPERHGPYVHYSPPQAVSASHVEAAPVRCHQPTQPTASAGILHRLAGTDGHEPVRNDAPPRPPRMVPRKFPRYRCTGGVAASVPGLSSKLWGQLTVVGEGGCYVGTISPFPTRTRVRLRIGAYGVETTLYGVVRYMQRGEGMGIMFTEITPEGTSDLKRIIAAAFRESA